MTTFHDGYIRFCSAKGTSQGLEPLLLVIYNQIHASPVNLVLLKESLIALFSFLSQPEYRTDENCRAVDLFFAINDHWHIRWHNLPDDYKSIMDDIGGCLHDTVSASRVAENFQSTPEQLAERAKQLKVP